uniref:Putative storage protein n=1 Tax=Eragrostis tef TaxID=110835 RepID=A0A173G7U7_ERATE|nr:putative storage protein [Eragrostis tef]
MATKVVTIFALLALLVSATTACSPDEYYFPSGDYYFPYGDYYPLQQAFATRTIQQATQQQILQAQQQQILQQVQQQQLLLNLFNALVVENPTIYKQLFFRSGACF